MRRLTILAATIAVAAATGCGPTTDPDLIGVWAADLDLTMEYPGNANLDKGEVRSTAHTFAIRMREELGFEPDGGFLLFLHGELQSSRKYRVVERDGDMVTIRVETRNDSFNDTFHIVDARTVASPISDDSPIWLVYRRVE
jgi:hypothetical protein